MCQAYLKATKKQAHLIEYNLSCIIIVIVPSVVGTLLPLCIVYISFLDNRIYVSEMDLDLITDQYTNKIIYAANNFNSI